MWEPIRTRAHTQLVREHSVTVESQSSHLAESLWSDPGLKSGISVRELISTKNKQTNNNNKTSGRGMNCPTFSQNPRMREKSQQQHLPCPSIKLSQCRMTLQTVINSCGATPLSVSIYFYVQVIGWDRTAMIPVRLT